MSGVSPAGLYSPGSMPVSPGLPAATRCAAGRLGHPVTIPPPGNKGTMVMMAMTVTTTIIITMKASIMTTISNE